MTREDTIALLKALSIIEGACRVAGGKIEEVVSDELDWIMPKIMKELTDEA